MSTLLRGLFFELGDATAAVSFIVDRTRWRKSLHCPASSARKEHAEIVQISLGINSFGLIVSTRILFLRWRKLTHIIELDENSDSRLRQMKNWIKITNVKDNLKNKKKTGGLSK